jgi:Fe-S-cluster-containing hydrogenase component 2
MCAAVCPFGAINFDSIGKRVIKCDLCDGDPLCAKFCAYGALQYVEASRQALTKQRQAADRLRELANAGRHHGV